VEAEDTNCWLEAPTRNGEDAWKPGQLCALYPFMSEHFDENDEEED
jgi:hypothetical protein